ncbi:thiamine biosynthesis protein ThiS [Marinomonas sp. UCMA 3892]|jgi:sulfur carrier protein|uniref:Thiamine biosynthesis protein ThiS n=1 Tax=Marinomonas sp. (strain MWYL1) TaxID=400668 RepID=A6VXY3_MARMS|nr:sulfur carrier protein ThiS [Marinomonas sp. UCMA 3892]NLU99067.1 thiamine biosynthesis protein ThiS [Marinomonas sp. UCMA 3892]
MKIMLNDVPHEFSGKTLQDLLIQLDKSEQGIAIAINQQVVPKSLWTSTKLNEQSQVFIFESIAGG